MVEVVAVVTCMKSFPKHLENLKVEAAQLGFDETELEFPKGFFCKRGTVREETGLSTLSLPAVLYSWT